MDVLEAIRRRRSIGRLVEPAPTAAELQQLLEAAVCAPDHKELQPWRFVVLEGPALAAFGDVTAAALAARQPDASPGQIEKERSKPLRAPMIVIVVTVRVESKLPFTELLAASAAATQNLLLAATALGFGSVWRTGDGAYDASVKRALGFDETDEITGIVYLGTIPDDKHPELKVPKLGGVVSDWTTLDT